MMAAEKGRVGALGTEIFDSAYDFNTAVCLCCFVTFGDILMLYCFGDIRLNDLRFRILLYGDVAEVLSLPCPDSVLCSRGAAD